MKNLQNGSGLGEKQRAFDGTVDMLVAGFIESLESKIQYLKPSEEDSPVVEGKV